MQSLQNIEPILNRDKYKLKVVNTSVESFIAPI